MTTSSTSSAAYISITAYGAVGDGTTNNQVALQNALNYAAANGLAVYIPPGNFAYSGTLTVNGVAVYGAGSSSILKALDGANESLILTGSGASVSSLQMDGTGTTRLTTPQSCEIWARGAQNYTIQNVLINGSSSGGIMSDDASHGVIANNTVENTLADSITNVGGSSYITVKQNRILNSGDDGISNVSYTNVPIVNNITIQGNTVLYNKGGRGISVVGGNNIQISGNNVQGGTAGVANIYIAAEGEWSTQGVNNVTVTGNTLINGGGSDNGGTGQGAITIYNSQSTAYTLSNITLSGNQIVNPLAQAFQFVGSGAETVQATNNSIYTSGTYMTSNGNPAAAVTLTGNQMLAPSLYTTPLVPAGGGVGSGTAAASTDTLTLRMAEDAWEGDAQFTVAVDGVQVGGTLTASALSSSNDGNVFTLTGNWGHSMHSVAISFINDAYGGSATTDRNLYVDSIGYDGATYQGTAATMNSNGTNTCNVGGTIATTAAPADTLTVNLSEDAWGGDAQFTLSIDGKTITTPQSVTALHSAAASEAFTYAGNFGAGSHTVGITFTNDAYGGSGTTDRNLYVNSVSVNGQSYGSGVTGLYSNGTTNFAITTTH